MIAHFPPDVDAALVLGQPGPIAQRAQAAGIPVLILSQRVSVTARRTQGNPLVLARSVFALLGQVRPLFHYLRDSRVDVVVAVGMKAIIYTWPAARLARTKVVWSLHDRIDPEYFARVFVPVLRYLLPRVVDGLIVNSRSTLATVRPGRTPVLVGFPGSTLPEDIERGSGEQEIGVVLMLGRLSSWKGQDLFLRAFAQVFAGTDTHARIVGGALFGESDYERELHELATALGIGDQVQFTGHVSDPWPHIVAADVLVHASRIPEPFGQVVVQGMWGGCAVIATTPGGPAEVITDGVDGLLVPAGDEEAMVVAMTRLREDATLRAELVEAGPSSAERFSSRVTAPPVAAWLTRIEAGSVERSSVAANVAP